MAVSSIRIPLLQGEDKDANAKRDLYCDVFPDEIPEDSADFIDLLVAEFAPLRLWKSAAVSQFCSIMLCSLFLLLA